MTITKPPKLSEMPMMCISSSQMKYGTAFKQPSKSSIFDRPNDSQSSQFDIKADLRRNKPREKTRREVNIKYSNRELSPLNRLPESYENSKFV